MKYLVLVFLVGCAATTNRGIDGDYRVDGGTMRVAGAIDPEEDFVLILTGDLACEIHGRWIEARSDYFEPTMRAVCTVRGVDGVDSFSVENDRAEPITGTLTAGSEMDVRLALQGVCHRTDGISMGCNFDLHGVR